MTPEVAIIIYPTTTSASSGSKDRFDQIARTVTASVGINARLPKLSIAPASSLIEKGCIRRCVGKPPLLRTRWWHRHPRHRRSRHRLLRDRDEVWACISLGLETRVQPRELLAAVRSTSESTGVVFRQRLLYLHRGSGWRGVERHSDRRTQEIWRVGYYLRVLTHWSVFDEDAAHARD